MISSRQMMRRARARHGAIAMIEATFSMIMLATFLLALYGLAHIIWTRTVLDTSTRVAAQSALVRYDRYAFHGEFGAEADRTAAQKQAVKAARMVMDSAISGSTLKSMQLEDGGCPGYSGPIAVDVKATPKTVDGRRQVVITTTSRAQWSAIEAVSGCLTSTASITGTG